MIEFEVTGELSGWENQDEDLGTKGVTIEVTW